MPFTSPRSTSIELYLPKWPEELVKLIREYSFMWDSECNVLKAHPTIFSRMEMVIFSTYHKHFVLPRENYPGTCALTGFGVGNDYKIFFNPDNEATDIQLQFCPEIRKAIHCDDLDFMGPALIYPDFSLFGEEEDF